MQSLFFIFGAVNWRWNITALIIALAFFGISLEQTNADPNQEILIQFNSDSISDNEERHVISDIKNQLKEIGIEDVQVSKTPEGRLKVSYYSEVDVAVVKNLFYKQNKPLLANLPLSKDKGSIPFSNSNDSRTYIVEVVKIQSDFNADIGLQGVLVEIKSTADQYLKPKVLVEASEVKFALKFNSEGEACTSFKTPSLFVENTNYRIPESRAGPLS